MTPDKVFMLAVEEADVARRQLYKFHHIVGFRSAYPR